jgi:uncharacterized coiled-coil protein SlyX
METVVAVMSAAKRNLKKSLTEMKKLVSKLPDQAALLVKRLTNPNRQRHHLV